MEHSINSNEWPQISWYQNLQLFSSLGLHLNTCLFDLCETKQLGSKCSVGCSTFKYLTGFVFAHQTSNKFLIFNTEYMYIYIAYNYVLLVERSDRMKRL